MVRQVAQLPEATHLVLSVGGKALEQGAVLLHEPAESVAEGLSRLADIREQFQRDYRDALGHILARRLPTAVCTIYDSIPDLDRVEATGLCLFNDVILREAFRAGLPVIDLRLVCTDPDDYAPSSPIEPSVAGRGAKSPGWSPG